MRKFLALVLAVLFMAVTSGVVLAQDAPATTPAKKTHKVHHKAKKAHHAKKTQAPAPEAPAAK